MSGASTEALFSAARTGEKVELPVRYQGTGWLAAWGLADGWFLLFRLLGFGHLLKLGLTALAALGALPPALSQLVAYRLLNPGLGLNVFLRDLLLALLLFMGAFNGRLRTVCAALSALAYAVATLGCLAFAALASDAAVRAQLQTGARVEGALFVLALLAAWANRRHGVRLLRDIDYPNVYSPSRGLMRGWLLLLGVIELGLLANALYSRFSYAGGSGFAVVYSYPDLSLVENLSKFSLLAALCWLMAYHDELRETFYPLLLQELGFGVVAATTWLMVGDRFSGSGLQLPTGVVSLASFYGGFIASEGAFALLAGAARGLYYDMELRITTLTPGGARGALALHDALFPSDLDGDTRLLDADSGAVIEAVDRFAATIRSRKRGIFALPFFLLEYVITPLYWVRPPFSTQSRAERLWLLKRRILGPGKTGWALSRLLSHAFGGAHSVIVFAHYAGRHARRELYVPPEARERLQPEVPIAQAPAATAATLPQGPDDEGRFRPKGDPTQRPAAPRLAADLGACPVPKDCDFLVVGSGAGGAVVAYRLARAFPGKQIVVVERGPHLSPLSDFSGGELEMVSKLYKEGGLQQSRRFGITVLQAECVGGGTMVNNGVCLQIPDAVRERWAQEFGLEELMAKLPDAYERVAKEIGISDIPGHVVNQAVLERFEKAVNALSDDLHGVEALQVNASLVQGTGEWNLGDRGMRKHTALQTYLAWAQGLTAAGGTALCLLPETSALRVEFDSSQKRATSVLVQRAFDAVQRIHVRQAVVVAAGVVASSHFLMRSGCGERLSDLGKHVSCNLALPAFFEFNERIDAFDGLEITHGARAKARPAVFETHFLTPGMFSLAVPFFFNRLCQTMHAYRKLATVGCLVTSEPNGAVREKPGTLDDSPLDWELSRADLEHLTWAIGTQVKLARAAGATRVVLSTNPGIVVELDQDADAFLRDLEQAARTLQMGDFRLATAHPQGGNRMGGERVATRVVDSDFCLRGHENVFVADASLFPTGVGTNPQWTVMALASLAADSMVAKFAKKTAA
jgi:choline dehydrogenase-like flavoprotein